VGLKKIIFGKFSFISLIKIFYFNSKKINQPKTKKKIMIFLPDVADNIEKSPHKKK
jgi:hypothetical protein